jgi:hypothetical protein
MNEVDQYIGSLEALKVLRAPWENMWQDAMTYILPNRGDFTQISSKGGARTDVIFEGTAGWANEQLAAGLSGLLTSPTERWFKLRFADAKVDKKKAARAYLQAVEDILYDEVFNSPVTNFASQSHEAYLDLGAFGTSVMMVEDRAGHPINFQTFHLGNCYIAEDFGGLVNTVYRIYKKTGVQLLSRYAEMFSPEQIKKFREKPYDMHECLHVVEPNENTLPNSSNAIDRPFKNVLLFMGDSINKDRATILEKGGYYEFPYVVPRWMKTAEEIYGRGSGSTAMPDIKLVNQMIKTIIVSCQKQVDPSLQVPDDGFMLPIKTNPGGINFYRSGTNDRIEPLLTQGRTDHGMELLSNRLEHIMRVFHIDTLRLKENGPEMTATEALIRKEDKMRTMAPMTGRLQSEMTGRIIRRVYAVLERRKRLPDFPAEFSKNSLKIEYASPVSRAQKATQLQNVSRLLETFMPLVNVKPDILDKFNSDGYYDWVAQLMDAPISISSTDDEVKAVRDARTKAQNEEQQKSDLERAAAGGVNVAKSQSLMQGANQ